MASSSSAPAPKPRPNEVFLSFRGEDTRNNFVSHLRSALERRGVITYYDATNLRNGQTISSELVKAIRESAIAIVVLSENYGSSTWCLKELAEIVECKNNNNLTIYPIFYHVDPSDVRHQRNSFFEAFSIHEVNLRDEIGMVNTWREALTQVANLTGMDIRNRDEASCIEKIANEILWNLPPDSHFTESLVGMESRIFSLRKLIDNNPDEVRFIGIWGMGGVGKTTTAKAIFKECKSDFEGSCLLPDVRQRKNKMEKLQKLLISQVLKCKIKDELDTDDVDELSSMIRQRMCSKRVLLVLDDVDDKDQLKYLAGNCDWFGKGSRIIITTRDDHLLKDVQDKYKVVPLNDKEALLLFRAHAFKKEHIEENYEKLSDQVLSYAGGLPLALKVLGDHLYGEEESFWSATLRRLEEFPEPKINSILQISFDSLNPNEKDIFLYIACLFRGGYCVEVMERLRALKLHPDEGIKVLIRKSLIHEYESDEDHDAGIGIDKILFRIGIAKSSFEMHDLLQDMGHDIVRKKANLEVQKYSHLWLDKDIKSILSDDKGLTEAKGIIINWSFRKYATKFLKKESFVNMNKLRFLHIEGSFHKSNFLVQLPIGLLWLYWYGYPGECIKPHPSIPMDLVHLEMPNSKIERTPDFSLMPDLEVLDLNSSKKLVEIHHFLGRHKKIKRIDLQFCEELEEFPTIIGMDSLEYLNLSVTSLRSFPEIRGNVNLLKELNMHNSQIERTTDLSLMPNLEVLGLGGSEKLVDIHPFLGCHTKIKRIDLQFCEEMKEFPTIIRMNSLEYLNLSGTGLRSFPKICENVDSLKELEMTHSQIERTPDFSLMPNLEVLDFSESYKLVHIHPSLGGHTKIKSINLNCCESLEEFPTIVDMRSLRILNLSYTQLQCFPKITGNVDKLEKLELEGTCISTLPQSIGLNLSIPEIRENTPVDSKYSRKREREPYSDDEAIIRMLNIKLASSTIPMEPEMRPTSPPFELKGEDPHHHFRR